VKKILIVEDEIGIVQFLKEGLEEEGFEVEYANDGVAGLKLATEKTFDLLLLDWMMPKMTGLELCKKFRESNSSTPIIFLTAKDTIQEAVEGLKSGANDYIKKTFLVLKNFWSVLKYIFAQKNCQIF
jgi:DNA-binding response OmpR family regulator